MRGWIRLHTLRFATLSCSLAIAAAFAARASSMSVNTNMGNGGSSSTATSGPVTAQQILAKAQQQQLTSASFTINQQIQTPHGTLTSHGSGKLQETPFAEEINTTASLNGQQVRSQAIYANGNVYARSANSSSWIETPSGQIVNSSAAAPDLSHVATLPNATLVGTETVNGVKTYRLRGYGMRTVNGQSVAYKENLWIRQDSFQPAQRTDVANLPIGSMQSTVVFTGWNTNLSIQTPAPSAISTVTAPATPFP